MEFDRSEHEKSKSETPEGKSRDAIQENSPNRIEDLSFSFARMTNTATVPQGQFRNLDEFPTELGDMICRYLPKDSLAKLRVTNQSFYKVATRHLFREVNVELTTRSLRNLIQISRRQDLGQYVVSVKYTEKLIFQQPLYNFMLNEFGQRVADRYVNAEISDYDDSDEDILDKEELEVEQPPVNHVRPRTRPDGRPVPDDIFIDRWKQYRKPRCKQDRLLTMDQDVAVLMIALDRLPKLIHVSLNIPNVNRAIKIWRSYQHKTALFGGPNNPTKPAHLTTLESHGNCWKLFQIHNFQVTHGVTVFASLRHLAISFEASNTLRFQRLDELLIQHQTFGAVLRAATGLETLSLHFGDPDKPPSYYAENRGNCNPVRFAHIVEDTTFHQLRQLDLASVTVAETHFTAFLKRHAHSLEGLRMRNMWLEEKTKRWLHVFTEIQTTMKLKDLLLSSTWGGATSEHGSHLLLFLSRHHRPIGFPGPEELEQRILKGRLRSYLLPREVEEDEEDEADRENRLSRAARMMARHFENYLTRDF